MVVAEASGLTFVGIGTCLLVGTIGAISACQMTVDVDNDDVVVVSVVVSTC